MPQSSQGRPKRLTGRPLEIVQGLTGLPQEKVQQYRALFEAQGFELPPPASTVAARGRRRPHNGFRSRPSLSWISAFTPVCRFLGEVTRHEPCRWGAASTVAVHDCRHPAVRCGCVLLSRERKRLADGGRQRSLACCETCPHAQLRARYISNEQFARDTLALIGKLPPDIGRVAGVARSGLYPATMIAMMLHLPLTIVRHRHGDWIEAGHGWRLNEGGRRRSAKVLVVDDTTMTGNSLRKTKQVIAGMPGEKVYSAVYVNPLAVAKPDVWAVDLPWPHLLQWNLFNSVMIDSCAFDFDGILCHDCPPRDDDDGPRYVEFLRDVRPLHLVRRRPLRLVVTARLEKYRPQTMAWLRRWGIRVDRLVMGPWRDNHERRRADVAAFKGQQFQQFLGGRRKIRPKMFVESDRRQASRISELTGGLVVCPAAGCCFVGGRQA